MREFSCHFYDPAKITSVISPQNEDGGRHVPFARSGAQIEDPNLALRRAPSQNVPERTNIVAIQKLFKQIVLDIHSLYARHPIYGNVVRKNRMSTLVKESWNKRGSGGLGLNRKTRTLCSCPSTGNG